MRKTLILLRPLSILFVLTLAAQDTRPTPTCNKCSATFIGNDEIQAYLNRAPARIANAVSDQQVRAINAGKTNIGVGVVYRSGTQSEGSAVAEHDQVSEVYHVLDGSATLVTGPDIVDWKPRPADNEAVRLLNGPGGNGASIRGGVTYQLKAGDVIVIPAGVGHWFAKVDDHIRYLMIRVDPDKVTPLKDEAASKADLSKTGK
jgi:mannose-6-phosphate isomerase-like protein (cupin superfamily)